MKNTVKRFVAIALVLCLAAAFLIAFVACNDDKDREGKLYVGLECAYAPFNYTQFNDDNGAVKIANADGYANGYDIMIAKKIAEELNKELVVYKYEFNSLIPAVNSGALDMIIAGMSPTAERLNAIDFSTEYYESNLVIVVRKDSGLQNATSLEDFRGKKIVAQQGTFHDTALSDQGGKYGILRQTPMENFPFMINALKANAVDGYIAEEPGAIENCASNPEFDYVRLVNNSTGFEATKADTAIAVGIKKGSALKEQINAVLAKISLTERQTMMETAIALSVGTNVVE